MSRPGSPASSDRSSTSTEKGSARAGFLARALGRLTSGGGASKDRAESPKAASPDPPENTPRRTRKRKSGAQRRKARRLREEEAKRQAKAVQVPVVDNPADSLHPLSATDLTGSTISWSEDAHSAFGTDVTISLLSHEDAVSYASSILLESLSTSNKSVPFHKRSTGDRLAFYQSLILQFNLCSQSCLPGSITKCEKVLRTIHIAVGEYLAVVKRGGNVAKEVTRYKSAQQLRKALFSGGGPKTVSREVIKSQLLAVFLVTIPFTFHLRLYINMSTIAKTEAHAGAGDAGEGYQPPQGGPRYEEGKENSHKALDSTDERSIANRLAAAEKAEKESSDEGNAYAGVGAAEAHGNKPSRGAQIDAELQKEEEELLAKKDK
ncbi:hypothetical protein JCM10908_006547 [Rhodotorula pacifica]|uniref:uncharacterized protein n=1 Tax=Rhodotorula pacifica TaxID=1495444 RepID=UPI003176AFB7